jgi:hypothetical protein
MSHTKPGAVELTIDSQLRRCLVLNGGAAAAAFTGAGVLSR